MHPIYGSSLKFLLDKVDRNHRSDETHDLLCPDEIAFHAGQTIEI